MKWAGESKTCSRESVAKGLAKGCYNLNESSGWFLTPLKSFRTPRVSFSHIDLAPLLLFQAEVTAHARWLSAAVSREDDLRLRPTTFEFGHGSRTANRVVTGEKKNRFARTASETGAWTRP